MPPYPKNNVCFKFEYISSSLWQSDRLNWMMGQEIRDSVVGFYGFGSIGQAIAKRLQGWEVKKCIYHTRNRKENEADFNAQHVSFEQLLKESDFLVLACPLTTETRHKFNKTAFEQMKTNCVFVNVGRGGKNILKNVINQIIMFIFYKLW